MNVALSYQQWYRQLSTDIETMITLLRIKLPRTIQAAMDWQYLSVVSPKQPAATPIRDILIETRFQREPGFIQLVLWTESTQASFQRVIEQLQAAYTHLDADTLAGALVYPVVLTSRALTAPLGANRQASTQGQAPSSLPTSSQSVGASV